MHTDGVALLRRVLCRGDTNDRTVVFDVVLAEPPVVLRLDDRDLVEVVFRRRRRDRPLEAAGIPRIGTGGRQVRSFLLGLVDVPEEVQHRRTENVGADRGDEVPELEAEARRIGVDATAHALQAEHVHRAEGQVEADEHGPEVDLAAALIEE